MFDEIGPHLHAQQTAPAARTVGEMFWLRAARSASNPALFHKEEGAWRKVTWAGFKEAAAEVAKGLLALDLSAGDRVAILGPTQPPWAYYDMGAQLAGMVSFGIYPKQSPAQIRYLLEHSDAQGRSSSMRPEELRERPRRLGRGGQRSRRIVPWTPSLYREPSRARGPASDLPGGLRGRGRSTRRRSKRHPGGDRPRRDRDPRLHLGHHRAPEGGDDQPPEHPLAPDGQRRTSLRPTTRDDI